MTTQKPCNTWSGSWLKNLTKRSARCLSHSIPFMFAILQSFIILMVAMAERPQRFNYGMTSNHMRLDLDEAKPLRPASDCESFRSEFPCTHNNPNRCMWQKKNGCVSACRNRSTTNCDNLSCELKWMKCEEFNACRSSLEAKEDNDGHKRYKYYEAGWSLVSCLSRLGFEAFPEGYDVSPFVVNPECSPFEKYVYNPLDCIDDSFVVTMHVAQPSSRKPKKVLFCRQFIDVALEEFPKKCLVDWQKDFPGAERPWGKTPEIAGTEEEDGKWTPVLFVRFGKETF